MKKCLRVPMDFRNLLIYNDFHKNTIVICLL
jgi:hypothetical protein